MKNLKFAYGADERPALNGISFSVAEGAQIAIVGASGAGKSTLANLLLRFWEFKHGEILLNGQDIRQYSADDVRAFMAVVSQNTHLFNATIAENLRLGNPHATDAEMFAAAQHAQIHTFIQSLPDGYGTIIGEQGLQLSGGERQRLAIARALLKNAPLLILDEATANLDALTEREVLKTLRAVSARHTTISITHRLTGLEAMNEILVLDAGHIVEQGTHAELLAQGGLYRRMWMLQQQWDTLESGGTTLP